MGNATLTADDLLRRQEQPLRKKRRLSYSDSENDSNSQAPSESGSNELTHAISDNGDSFQVDSALKDHSRFSNRTTSGSPQLQAGPPANSYTFSSLGISAPLQTALKNMSIKLPTEVQAACIPPLLEGKRNLISVESLYALISV